MKAGEVVMIYEDPLTMQKPEGKAKLIKRVRENESAELWTVAFLSEDESTEYLRWLKKEETTS